MGRQTSMSWEGPPNNRWVKMHQGVRYRVTCEQLGVPTSKQDSYQAANRWWQAKLAEIQKVRMGEERCEAVADIDRKLAYASTHAPKLVPELTRARKAILASAPDERVLTDQDVINENIRIATLFGIKVPSGLDPMVCQHLFGDRRIWEERLSGTSLIGKDRTVGHCMESFLKEVQPTLKPKSFRDLADYLRTLTESSGVWTAQTDVASINEETVQSHHGWLTSKAYTPDAHNKRLAFFRRFVRWLWDMGKLQNQPRNLQRKEHKRKKKHRKIPQYQDTAQAIVALPADMQLWALLGLNCGMTNADLGALDWSEIQCNANLWTLTRRRVKTGDQPSVPTVTYKLWPEVVEKLQAMERKKGLVFQTRSGTAMYHSHYGEDESGRPDAKVTDNFSQRWGMLKTKPRIPLSHFRKISATALRSDNRYARFDEYFLGHAPRTVADRHYSAESDVAFFEALDFLHDTLLGTKSRNKPSRQKRAKHSKVRKT